MANVRFSHLCYNKSMLIIDEDLIEIDDLVENIVQAFSCFPEVEAYRHAKTKFTEDEILQKKITQLNENQKYITFRPELRALQKEINTNVKVYPLRLAENDVQAILSDLTKAITQSISDNIYVDENLPLKGGRHERHHGHHG